MISNNHFSKLQKLVMELDKVLDESDAKAFCQLCSNFKRELLQGLKESTGCENFVKLVESVIDN